MKGGLIKVQDDFTLAMKAMLDRSKSPKAGFARIYKVYQRLQTKRFMTENSSEGEKWGALNSDYKKYKEKRYGGGPKRDGGTWKSWPGGGRKMLIGTGTLAGAVIGPGSPFDSSGISAHRALFTSSQMTISVETSGMNAEGKPFDYAEYVNDKRPFMEFSDASIEEMKKELTQFIFGGL